MPRRKSEGDPLSAPLSHVEIAGFEERAERAVSLAWRSAWKPRSRLEVDEWADENIWLSERTSATTGRWRTSFTPYLREIMREYSNPHTRKITFMSGSQLGKTSLVIICLGYTVDVDPQPTLFVFPTEQTAKGINKDRILEGMKVSPALSAHLSGNPWDEKNLQINFDNMNLWFGWSGSRISIASRAIGRVFGDEIDEWKDPDETIARTEQRTKTFQDSKIVLTSTPTYENTGIHAEFLKGDQREYFVPCPHCGCYQTLKFERIRWPVPEGALSINADPAEAERRAWYECEACETPVDHSEKHGMLARGVWAKKGQRVLQGGVLDGQPERPDDSHASFRLNSLYSPFIAWGKLARQFLEYGGSPPMAWINGELGDPMREKGESADARAILIAAKEDKPDYQLGTAPHDARGLILTSDVQGDHVYYLVTAWAADQFGEWCSIVDADKIDCPEAPLGAGAGEAYDEQLVLNSWSRVQALLGRPYAICDEQGAPTQRLMTPAVVGIDAGFRTEEVYRFCRRHGVYAMFGRSRRQVPYPYDERMIDRLPDGRALAGGVRAITHNTDMWKDYAYRMMNRRAPVHGYLRLPTNLDTRKWIAEQLTAERRVEEAGRRGMSTSWQLKLGRGDNHLWDCLVMACVLADRYLVPVLRAQVRQNLGQHSTGVAGARRQYSIPL